MAGVAVRELAGHGVPFVKLWVEDPNGLEVPGREGPFILSADISGAAIAEAHALGKSLDEGPACFILANRYLQTKYNRTWAPTYEPATEPRAPSQ